jgi:hypothetical protein
MRRTAIALAVSVLIGATAAWSEVNFPLPGKELPEDNAFDYYLYAFEQLPPGRPWDNMASDLDKVTLQDAEVAVLEAQASLDTLREGLGKPCQAPPPEEGLATPLPYLADFRSTGRLLVVESWLRYQSGDCPGAFRSCLDAIALGQDAARGGAVIHKLVSIACEAAALRQVRKLVDLGQVDETSLTKLIEALNSAETREPPLADCLACEYVGIRQTLSKMREGGTAEEAELLGPTAPATPAVAQKALAALDGMFSEAVTVARLDDWREQVKHGDIKTDDPLLGTVAPVMRRVLEKTTQATAALRGTVLAAALGLTLKHHQQYPTDLGQLVPEALKELPVDPFSGEGFRYALVDPLSYSLYSVGPNMKDDGGTGDDIPLSPMAQSAPNP